MTPEIIIALYAMSGIAAVCVGFTRDFGISGAIGLGIVSLAFPPIGAVIGGLFLVFILLAIGAGLMSSL